MRCLCLAAPPAREVSGVSTDGPRVAPGTSSRAERAAVRERRDPAVGVVTGHDLFQA